MEERIIVWRKSAVKYFERSIDYIYKDSPQNANKVEADILLTVKSLLKYPEKFPPDKYKLSNQENLFRAFEKHRLRISYSVEPHQILIIRVRHTSQTPQSY